VELGKFLAVKQGELSGDERLVIIHRHECRNFDQRWNGCQELTGGTLIAMAGMPGIVRFPVFSRRSRLGVIVSQSMRMAMCMTVAVVMTVVVSMLVHSALTMLAVLTLVARSVTCG